MSLAGPATRVAVGVAGVSMMADAVYKYVYAEVDQYTVGEFMLGASMTLSAIVLPCGLRIVPIAVTPVMAPPSGSKTRKLLEARAEPLAHYLQETPATIIADCGRVSSATSLLPLLQH